MPPHVRRGEALDGQFPIDASLENDAGIPLGGVQVDPDALFITVVASEDLVTGEVRIGGVERDRGDRAQEGFMHRLEACGQI